MGLSESLATAGLEAAQTKFEGEFSPLGAVFLRASTTALELARGGLSSGDVAEIGSGLLDLAAPFYDEILSGVAASAAAMGLGAIADVIPMVGQAVGAIVSMAGAQVQAEQAEKVEACVSSYQGPLPGTGPFNQRVPADLFGHRQKAPINPAHVPERPIPWSDCARLAYYVVEDTIPGVELSPETAHGYKYSSFADPEFLDWWRKLMAKAPFSPPHLRLKDEGVPKPVRKTLSNLRASMTLARGKSFDGGAMVFPVYLDLLWSQYEMGRLSDRHAWFVFINSVTSPECSEHDRRGYDEYMHMLRGWHLTANPTYGVDRAKLAVFLESMKKVRPMAIRPISPVALQGFRPTQKKLATHTLPKLQAVTSKLANRGVSIRPIPASLAKSLGTKPNTAVPPEDANTLLALIRAAAKGADAAPVAEAVAVEAARDESPELALLLEHVLALVEAAEDDDADALETIDYIADEAEAGDVGAIELVGYIVAVLDALDQGLISEPDASIQFDVYDVEDDYDERAYDESDDDDHYGDLYTHLDACAGVGAAPRKFAPPKFKLKLPPKTFAAPIPKPPVKFGVPKPPPTFQALKPLLQAPKGAVLPFLPAGPRPSVLAQQLRPMAVAPLAARNLPPMSATRPFTSPAMTAPLVSEPAPQLPEPQTWAAEEPIGDMGAEYDGPDDSSGPDPLDELAGEWDGGLGYDWGGGDDDGYPYDGSTYGWC